MWGNTAAGCDIVHHQSKAKDPVATTAATDRIHVLGARSMLVKRTRFTSLRPAKEEYTVEQIHPQLSPVYSHDDIRSSYEQNSITFFLMLLLPLLLLLLLHTKLM